MSLSAKVETVGGKERAIGQALLVTGQKERNGYRWQKNAGAYPLGSPLIPNASLLYRGPRHGHIFKERLENHGEIISSVISPALNQLFSAFLQEETRDRGWNSWRNTMKPVSCLTRYFQPRLEFLPKGGGGYGGKGSGEACSETLHSEASKKLHCGPYHP